MDIIIIITIVGNTIRLCLRFCKQMGFLSNQEKFRVKNNFEI